MNKKMATTSRWNNGLQITGLDRETVDVFKRAAGVRNMTYGGLLWGLMQVWKTLLEDSLYYHVEEGEGVVKTPAQEEEEVAIRDYAKQCLEQWMMGPPRNVL